MRPAILFLAAGLACGGLGKGLQLFKEPLDLPFMASVVVLQLSFCGLHHLLVLLMSLIFIPTDKTSRCIRAWFLDLLRLCVCVYATPTCPEQAVVGQLLRD